FQFESHGMRDILRRYQPTRIEDLTALNALYRPGPIQGGMIDDFINRKQGKTRVSLELPELKDILEETYGVILYQEQVMQIARRTFLSAKPIFCAAPWGKRKRRKWPRSVRNSWPGARPTGSQKKRPSASST